MGGWSIVVNNMLRVVSLLLSITCYTYIVIDNDRLLNRDGLNSLSQDYTFT